MASSALIIDTSSTTNDQILSANELYSTYEAHSSSPNISRSSSLSSIDSASSSLSCILNKSNDGLEINKINSSSILSSTQRKESIPKLPYPVLSDHRDPSSILILLQKETQTTSKKISNVIKQIEDCEQRLTLNIYTETEKKTFKYERVKLKQQLDALKKHERRVNLQIDFITTKSEIIGLEDEQKQNETDLNIDECQQIKILLGKLKQKLDKMKIYMRTRNEQMKQIANTKQTLNNSNASRKSFNQKQLSTKDMDRKRPSTSPNHHPLNKRLKPPVPIVRLASRATNHDSKQLPIVRFITKTLNVPNSSASPTTPASSSSTLSPPVMANRTLEFTNSIENSLKQDKIQAADDDDDDDDLDLELNIDELFNEETSLQKTNERFKVTSRFQVI